jgi:hypothetical protein
LAVQHPDVTPEQLERELRVRGDVVETAQGWVSLVAACERWTLETNSIERLRELQPIVLDVAPEAVLVTESTVPAERALAEHRESPAGASPGPAFDVQGQLATTAGRADGRLHASARAALGRRGDPALHGRTPRAAVAEAGAARAELEALLIDMEWMREECGGGMDTDRLRAHLGLLGSGGPT